MTTCNIKAIQAFSNINLATVKQFKHLKPLNLLSLKLIEITHTHTHTHKTTTTTLLAIKKLKRKKHNKIKNILDQRANMFRTVKTA